jgi:hypothetical protein
MKDGTKNSIDIYMQLVFFFFFVTRGIGNTTVSYSCDMGSNLVGFLITPRDNHTT